MKINKDIKEYLDKSVLCWLATVSEHNIPNVSPKEIFCESKTASDSIVIAHIASPKSIHNIKKNANVCVSFIDVFAQLGYKIIGEAKIHSKENTHLREDFIQLGEMAGSLFNINTLIRIKVLEVEPIKAPSYILYPETKVQDQISSALATYGVYKADHSTHHI